MVFLIVAGILRSGVKEKVVNDGAPEWEAPAHDFTVLIVDGDSEAGAGRRRSGEVRTFLGRTAGS